MTKSRGLVFAGYTRSADGRTSNATVRGTVCVTHELQFLAFRFHSQQFL